MMEDESPEIRPLFEDQLEGEPGGEDAEGKQWPAAQDI